MRVALITSFAASRKEPLLVMMDRVHQGFLDAQLEPLIRFNFGDPQLGGVSSVDRVLKRHPELARFVTDAQPVPGTAGARRISNGPLSAGSGESVPYATLQAIATGVPRSFPWPRSWTARLFPRSRAWPVRRRSGISRRVECEGALTAFFTLSSPPFSRCHHEEGFSPTRDLLFFAGASVAGRLKAIKRSWTRPEGSALPAQPRLSYSASS